MAEFIYQMYKARKAVGDKVILDDVTLSFYPGAKIGVVGPNGMGKSTLLKVMAGLEEVSNGEARLTPGYTVGILLQEPPLEEDKTVLENIQMAFADVLAKVGALQPDRRGDGRARRRLRRPHGRDGQAAGRDRRRERVGSRLPALPGHGRAAVSRPGRAREHPFRRRAPSRGAVRCFWTARLRYCSTSPPTTWTPSRSSGSNST